ncbi:MAG: ABC transporter substrate-binding protein [Burkholderiales bacterium]
MRRRSFCRALAATAAAALAHRAGAQPATPLRVAYLSGDSKDTPSPNFAAFRDGLAAQGYTEGRNLALTAWWGEGSPGRVTQLIPDVVGAQPDIVVAAGGLALFPLLTAGVKKPIVFSISADPVEAKIVESFARPGGNITGISLFTLDLVGKRLELLRAVLPRVQRVALVANPQHPGERKEYEAAAGAAKKLGIAVRYFPVSSGVQLEAAFTDIARAKDDAVVAFADGFTLGYAQRFADFSRETRIPAIDGWAPFAEAGNLMIYGPVISDVYRRLAQYVDRIAKGAAPGSLPIELPNKVELVINARAAKALGITIPPAVLARADRVIT